MTEWEPVDERERLAVVRELRAEHPGLDFENLLAGSLLGPASPDRPEYPVWEYLAVIASDPSVTLGELTAVRFPVLFFEGESSVTSIGEELRPLPSHLKDPPRAAKVVDADALIRRYALEHEAGHVQWDPVSRGIRYEVPVAARRAVLQEWSASLPPAD